MSSHAQPHAQAAADRLLQTIGTLIRDATAPMPTDGQQRFATRAALSDRFAALARELPAMSGEMTRDYGANAGRYIDDAIGAAGSIIMHLQAGDTARIAFLANMLGQNLDALRHVRGVSEKLKHKRKPRRQGASRIVPLTAAQTEAAQLVAEHKGDIAAAARAAGKSRQAMAKLYTKAMAKLGRSAGRPKPKMQALPTDRRGQADIAAPGET